jgi:PPOX class probable F420-dependent enzyme
MAEFESFEGQKYLNLETFRRNGQGVRTPVWFAAGEGPVLYAYSLRQSGKAKRIRLSGAVKIAPCDAKGRVTGPWVDARAEIVSGAEHDKGMGLINRKYWPLKQILDLTVMLFHRRERVVIAIRPV